MQSFVLFDEFKLNFDYLVLTNDTATGLQLFIDDSIIGIQSPAKSGDTVSISIPLSAGTYSNYSLLSLSLFIFVFLLFFFLFVLNLYNGRPCVESSPRRWLRNKCDKEPRDFECGKCPSHSDQSCAMSCWVLCQ